LLATLAWASEPHLALQLLFVIISLLQFASMAEKRAEEFLFTMPEDVHGFFKTIHWGKDSDPVVGPLFFL